MTRPRPKSSGRGIMAGCTRQAHVVLKHPQRLWIAQPKLTKTIRVADGLHAPIEYHVSLGQAKKAYLTVFLQNDLSLGIKPPRISPLRARLSPKMYAWFNDAHLGDASNRRAADKKYLLFVIGQRLKAHVEGERSLLTYRDLARILATHRDYPVHKTAEQRRKWVQRMVSRVSKLPCVTRYKRFCFLDDLLADHGGEDAICAHHAKAAKARRKNGALRAKRYRDSCKLLPSQPDTHIVTLQASTLLPAKTAHLYNASPPKIGRKRPQQAAGFVASRPKRAAAVSANRATKAQPSPPLVSFWSQRDKTLAQPAIPSWLKADVTRPDFDPRTNPAARRIYGHMPVESQFVAMLKREHRELAGLSYPALKRRRATNETLMAACHLLTRKKTVTKPVNWVMWMEKALRDGARRYA